jgi:probable phosphoglycerate mutase
MTFYILRHADKEVGDFYNPRLRHQDMPISAKGRRDAKKLYSFFADKDISRIYVSAYQRTGQTIADVADQLSLTPIVDERLNEVDTGLFNGMTEEEAMEMYTEELRAYRERKTDFRRPKGETGGEAQKRIVSFLEEKRELHGDENTIVVSHDGLIRTLMCYVMGIPVYKHQNFHVDTCGITELIYQPDYDEWKLIRFNQICS